MSTKTREATRPIVGNHVLDPLFCFWALIVFVHLYIAFSAECHFLMRFLGDVPLWELVELKGQTLRMSCLLREQRIVAKENLFRSLLFILSTPFSPVRGLCQPTAEKVRGNPRLGRFMSDKL